MTTGEDVRSCIAERRRVLAASPSAPPTPPTPPVVTPKPPAPPTPPPAPRLPSLTLSGKWSGACQGTSLKIGGDFKITVTNGRLSASLTDGWGDGLLTGTVKPDGAVMADSRSDADSNMTWTGNVVQRDGRWVGTGNWTSIITDLSRNCRGMWVSR